jgi:hypothetical protein
MYRPLIDGTHVIDYVMISGSSNAVNAKICWKIIWLTNDQSKVSYGRDIPEGLLNADRVLRIVLVGKKNLEVRPIAVNKVSVAKREHHYTFRELIIAPVGRVKLSNGFYTIIQMRSLCFVLVTIKLEFENPHLVIFSDSHAFSRPTKTCSAR